MCGFPTRIVVTHAYICLSVPSTGASRPGFPAHGMLPYHPRIAPGVRGFGGTLDARLLSTHGRSTSELLRTL